MALEDGLLAGLGRSQFFGSFFFVIYIGLYPEVYSSLASQLGAVEPTGTIPFQNHVLVVIALGVTFGYLLEIFSHAIGDAVLYSVFKRSQRLSEYDQAIKARLEDSVDFATVRGVASPRVRLTLLAHQLENDRSDSSFAASAELAKAAFFALAGPAFAILAVVGLLSTASNKAFLIGLSAVVAALLFALTRHSYIAFVRRTQVLFDTDEKVKKELSLRESVQKDRDRIAGELMQERNKASDLQQRVVAIELNARAREIEDAVVFMQDENPRMSELGIIRFQQNIVNSSNIKAPEFWNVVSKVGAILPKLTTSAQLRTLIETLGNAMEYYVPPEHYKPFIAQVGPGLMQLHKLLPEAPVSDSICRAIGFLENREVAIEILDEVVEMVTKRKVTFAQISQYGFTTILTDCHLSDTHRDLVRKEIEERMVRSKDEFVSSVGLELAKNLEKRNPKNSSRGQTPQWVRTGVAS